MNLVAGAVGFTARVDEPERNTQANYRPETTR